MYDLLILVLVHIVSGLVALMIGLLSSTVSTDAVRLLWLRQHAAAAT